MFPTQEVSLDNLTSSKNEISTVGKSFLFDFEAGEFVLVNGKLTEITGYEALKMWIKKILKTEKGKFDIYYGTSYGTTLLETVSSDYPYPFIKSEIEREIKETLLTNTAIKSADNFEFTRDKRTLKVSFTCHTVYGATESEVIL